MPKFLVKEYRELKWISDAHEVEVGAESEKYPKFHMRESSFCVNLGKKKKKTIIWDIDGTTTKKMFMILLWLLDMWSYGFQNPVAAQAANKGGGHPAALSCSICGCPAEGAFPWGPCAVQVWCFGTE